MVSLQRSEVRHWVNSRPEERRRLSEEQIVGQQGAPTGSSGWRQDRLVNLTEPWLDFQLEQTGRMSAVVPGSTGLADTGWAEAPRWRAARGFVVEVPMRQEAQDVWFRLPGTIIMKNKNSL